MSALPVTPRAPSAGLYGRLADLFRSAATSAPPSSLASGFVDCDRPADLWHPLGELPEHLTGGDVPEGAAKFCVFGGCGWIGMHGSRFSDRERQILANTQQMLTVTFNGVETLDASYVFDGRPRWTFFPVALPHGLASGDLRAVEIERDGQLLLSSFVSEDAAAANYQANLWLMNSRGRLSGAVRGAACDVPVEIRIGAKREWTLTGPTADPAKRPFEFDLAPWCAEGALVPVSVFNPTTGAEAQRSPIGVFASGGNHFLFADPQISGEACRAVLMFWKDGRRRSLSLATAGAVAAVNLDDAIGRRFDGGNNSFSLSLEIIRAGGVRILDEDGEMLGILPSLPEILEFTRAISSGRDELYERIETWFGAEQDNAALFDEMRAFWQEGDFEQARRCLLLAAARASGREETEALFRATAELALR
jgi:hypothetical protein